MANPKKAVDRPTARRAPALTLESRENQLISLAVDLAERKLSDGSATSQVITHYLKLGSTKERLEKEKLIQQNVLLKARTDALKSAKKVEELYENALDAMRTYKGESGGGGNDS